MVVEKPYACVSMYSVVQNCLSNYIASNHPFKKKNNPLLLHCWCQPTFSSGPSWTTFAGLGPTHPTKGIIVLCPVSPKTLLALFDLSPTSPFRMQKMSLDSQVMAGERGRVSCITFLAKMGDLLGKTR